LRNKIKILESKEIDKNKDLSDIKNLINSNCFIENINLGDKILNN